MRRLGGEWALARGVLLLLTRLLRAPAAVVADVSDAAKADVLALLSAVRDAFATWRAAAAAKAEERVQ